MSEPQAWESDGGWYLTPIWHKEFVRVCRGAPDFSDDPWVLLQDAMEGGAAHHAIWRTVRRIVPFSSTPVALRTYASGGVLPEPHYPNTLDRVRRHPRSLPIMYNGTY